SVGSIQGRPWDNAACDESARFIPTIATPCFEGKVRLARRPGGEYPSRGCAVLALSGTFARSHLRLRARIARPRSVFLPELAHDFQQAAQQGRCLVPQIRALEFHRIVSTHLRFEWPENEPRQAHRLRGCGDDLDAESIRCHDDSGDHVARGLARVGLEAVSTTKIADPASVARIARHDHWLPCERLDWYERKARQRIAVVQRQNERFLRGDFNA